MSIFENIGFLNEARTKEEYLAQKQKETNSKHLDDKFEDFKLGNRVEAIQTDKDLRFSNYTRNLDGDDKNNYNKYKDEDNAIRKARGYKDKIIQEPSKEMYNKYKKEIDKREKAELHAGFRDSLGPRDKSEHYTHTATPEGRKETYSKIAKYKRYLKNHKNESCIFKFINFLNDNE